jgi:ketosteroid isomerase-like protein
MRRQTSGLRVAKLRRMDQPREPTEQSQRILRMTPDGKSSTSIETVLRQRIEALTQAIREKDVDRLMSFYAPDVVAYDVRPPLAERGADAYRENFKLWFASFEGPITFELTSLRVAAGEPAAFCHYLALVVGARTGGRTSGYWVRGTTCFERREGEWLVTHEHISMPSA